MVGKYFNHRATSLGRPLLGTPQEKGKEGDHVTAGEGIWRQMLKVRERTGENSTRPSRMETTCWRPMSQEV